MAAPTEHQATGPPPDPNPDPGFTPEGALTPELGSALSLLRSAHSEDTWTEALFAIFAHIFPATPPWFFSLNTQYDLRVPVEPGNAASQSSRDFDGQAFEGAPAVPSLVITRGTMDNLRIAIVLEIIPSLNISRAESDKFKGYARTLEALGPSGAQATLMLIAGGFAFEWAGARFTDLHRMDVITPEYLAARAGVPGNHR